jgi:colanic acid/amylovoran biosynthesis protein
MKVVITNTVVLNGGDAAILMAIIRQVRAVYGPETDVVAADTQPDLAKQYYPDLTFITPLYVHAFPPKKEGRLQRLRGLLRYSRWYASLPRLYAAAYAMGNGSVAAARFLTTKDEWETLRHYAESDVIISTGGTYLVENYWLAPRIFDFRIALLLRKPLVLYTQSMGPFTSKYARSTLPSILKNAALVLLRDRASMDHVLDLCDASDINARLAADAAFGLAEPETLKAAEEVELPSAGLQVAVSVRYWPFFKIMDAVQGMDAYMSAMARTAEHLIEKYGASITFISTCQGVTGYTYDDSNVARDVAARIRQDLLGRVIVDSRFHRPEDLMHNLKRFDLVVATRMHMAILGLVVGVPVLPISYEFKTQSLFDRLGMGEFVCDIENVADGALQDTLDRLIDNLPSFRRTLFRKVEEERRRAVAAGEDLEVAVPEPTDDDDHDEISQKREAQSA